jgi:hypothetical protein
MPPLEHKLASIKHLTNQMETYTITFDNKQKVKNIITTILKNNN